MAADHLLDSDLLTPNVTYVASYFAPNGHYSADTNYFAANGDQ